MINLRKVKKYCKDYTCIENYEEAVNDKSQVWVCHHILGEILSREQLKDHDFYYDVPPCMLKFLTHAEHIRLHSMNMPEETRRKIYEANRRRTLSEESKKKISESLKGRIPWNKSKHHSEETRRKISEANKGKSAWNKGKRGIYSEETRRKQSESHKGLRWKLIDGIRVYYRNEEDTSLG